MIEKINSLKSKTQDNDVKSLCEKALSALSSTVYGNVPSHAKVEVEKAVIEDLFENLSKIEENETQEWLKNSKRVWAVTNLGVRDAINNLSEGETADNATLQQVLEYYKVQLEDNPEVLLFESFISGLQSFHYFPKVGNAVQAIKDRVDNYEADVSLTKIVETMKRSRSHYLVPLIEDLIQNYLDDKNMQTKSSLKEGLIKFSYDPFVRDIINLVTVDATELQLEYANAQCDIEKVYSPVLYLGENEAIFGVRGSFYVKKGNNLSRLSQDIVEKLDPDFVSVCEAINNPNVVIDGKTITVYEGSDKAVISKDAVLVNDQEFTNEAYKNSAEIAQWTGKGTFLSLVEMFRENFNEIAEVDFAKRVFLKENGDFAADVFRLRGNISLATYDPAMGKGTFYKNVNPIQAKNLMMEHLRFDVSKAFGDLLPNEEKINEEIETTKKEYSNYIIGLEEKINEFQANPYAQELNEEIVQALTEELTEIKNEYKDYLNLVETYMRSPEEALDEAKVTLDIEGPLNLEIDGQKYTVPLPDSTGEEGLGADEFGTEVGAEDMEGEPASAVTFDDMGSELLGDSPSVQADEVNLGADEIEADADAAEAEAEMGAEDEEGVEGEGEGEELGGELGDGEDENIEGGEADIKVGDEDELDLGLGGDEDEVEIEGEEEDKVEDSTSNSKPKELKRKVYLKKKKS